jgi:hypothetical protein
MIYPIHYQIFLAAPVCFHDPDSALVLIGRCLAGKYLEYQIILLNSTCMGLDFQILQELGRDFQSYTRPNPIKNGILGYLPEFQSEKEVILIIRSIAMKIS